MNRKVRGQLDLEGFQAIHAAAPAFLKIAMEQSLITLQARNEVCNMQYADYRDGYLFVIRDKTSGDSDMAFIKIAVTAELEDIKRRSRLDSLASPYVVHRAPSRRRREWLEGKPHWTFVDPVYLTRAFQDARDTLDRWTAVAARERPTFHEIRGLGARLCRDKGVAEEAIQALMTHAHRRTTQIYLDRGRAALTDADFISVATGLTLAELGIKGA